MKFASNENGFLLFIWLRLECLHRRHIYSTEWNSSTNKTNIQFIFVPQYNWVCNRSGNRVLTLVETSFHLSTKRFPKKIDVKTFEDMNDNQDGMEWHSWFKCQNCKKAYFSTSKMENNYRNCPICGTKNSAIRMVNYFLN